VAGEFGEPSVGVALVDAELNYALVDPVFASLVGQTGPVPCGGAVKTCTPGLARVLPGLREALGGHRPAPTSIELGGRRLTAAAVPLPGAGLRAAAALVLSESIDEQQLRISTLVARLSHNFIHAPASHIEEEIDRALALIGTALGVDRVNFVEFSSERTHFSVRKQWLAEGIESTAERLQDSPLASFGELAEQIAAGQEVQLHHLQFPAGHQLHELMLRAQSKVVAVLPIIIGGSPVGCVSFARVREDRIWTGAELTGLRSLAEMFANALDRKRTDDALQARLRFEQLLAELSTRLIDAPIEDIDAEIQAGVRAIAQSQGFHRTLVQRLDEKHEYFLQTHEWCAEGVPSFREAMTGLPIQQFGWPLGLVLAGQTMIFTRDDIPREAANARTVVERAGVQTMTLLPLLVAGATVGLISFQSMDVLRFPAEMVSRLTLLAQMVASALARKMAEEDRRRAYDELNRLKNSIESERDYLREEIRVDSHFDEIIGHSDALLETLGLVDAVATTNATVLLCGESGVGKELFARAIHARSGRAGGPLVKVNCASIPKDLFESEFFGHVRGSFTGALKDRAGRFELADGGTLFLDEVGEIPIELQAKLLRVLQEGEYERIGDDRTRKVDVRIIAATNHDLADDVETKRFRQDLYYRLSVFPIRVPTLRDRREDIVPLAEHFLRLHCRTAGRAGLRLSEDDRTRLRRYPWPGNIRELQHVMERAVILSSRPPLRVDLALPMVTSAGESASSPGYDAGRGRPLTAEELRSLERSNLIKALEQAAWRISGADGAAAILGLSPSTLRDRMRALGIKRPA
jgi:transcriptional regulator with GAF, ATPase, and Fis domain